jgi:hypothetical protein
LSDTGKAVPEREAKQSDAAREAERKRRQAQVFGEVLPEGTRDERAGSWGDREGGRDDEWFRNQVPPHHG